MFWQTMVEQGLHESSGLVLLSVLLVVLCLLVWNKTEIRAMLIVTGIFVLCLLGQVAAGVFAAAGWRMSAAYLRWFAILGEGLCLIRLGAIAVFRQLLPMVQVTSPHILQDVLVAVIYLVWGLIWLRANGVDPTSIFATSAVLTAVIGFSLQDTLGNILGGLAVEMDQSVRVGDWIQVNDRVGRVVDIGWRQTSIETRNWETVIVPNSMLVKNQVMVLGRRLGQPRQWRRWVWFNVDLHYDPLQVIDVIEKTMRTAAIPCVASTPLSDCILKDFAGSYGRYVVRYWLTDIALEEPTDSQIRTHIYLALKRAGMSLAIPTQRVWLSDSNGVDADSQEQASLAQRLDIIEHLDLLRLLPPEARQQVAEHLHAAPFAAGDVLVQQGEPAHWLYCIVSGQVEVVVKNTEGLFKQVAELGPGQFFGEIGLLMDTPCTATVIARTAVNCYRLDRTTFRDMLQAQPALADDVAMIFAQRHMELQTVIANLDAEAQARQLSTTHRDLRLKLRQFLGLKA